MLSIETDKLWHAHRSQEKFLTQHMVAPRQYFQPNDFVQDILELLEREIPRLYSNKPSGSPPTSDSRSPPSSPNTHQLSPITPPSPPPRPDGGNRGSTVRPQSKEMLSPALEIPRRRVHQKRYPVSDGPLSSPAAYIDTNFQPISTTQSLERVHVEAQEEGSSDKDSKEQTGPYMPMPPFGLPMLAPRPRAGRALDSSDDLLQSESRPPRTESRSAQQRSGGPSSSRAKRQNGSTILVYGNDGEVTPIHLTGSLGRQSGYERKKRPGGGSEKTP